MCEQTDGRHNKKNHKCDSQENTEDKLTCRETCKVQKLTAASSDGFSGLHFSTESTDSRASGPASPGSEPSACWSSSGPERTKTAVSKVKTGTVRKAQQKGRRTCPSVSERSYTYAAVVPEHVLDLVLQAEEAVRSGPAGRRTDGHVQLLTHLLTPDNVGTVGDNCNGTKLIIPWRNAHRLLPHFVPNGQSCSPFGQNS